MTSKQLISFALIIFIALAINALAVLVTSNKLNYSKELENKKVQDLLFFDNIYASLRDAETGQRGYIITGRDSYLEPYNKAIEFLNSQSSQDYLNIKKNEPGYEHDITQLQSLIQEKLDELKSIIDLRKEQGFSAAQKKVETGVGKKWMDQIRELIESIQTNQQDEVRRSQETTNHLVKDLFLLIVIVKIIAFAIMGFTFLLLYFDIKKHKENESMLRKYNAELAEARKKAIISSNAKSLFLTNVSHDLRTPLNSIIGFSDLLLKNKEENLNTQQLSFLKRVSENGKHLLNLINSILDLSIIEEGKVEITNVKIHLDSFIQSILKQLEGDILDSEVKLVSEIPAKLEPIYTDSEKLTRILINLLGNAIKFTEKGYVKVRVLKDQKNNPIQIDVIDTGKGISKSEQTRIFEPFAQEKDDTKGRFRSYGLGLSIALSLSRLLNYDIKVSSEIGKGSTFSLIMPSPSASFLKQPIEDPSRKDQVLQPNISQKTVLIIDDDKDACYLLTQYFEDLGCKVIVALTGQEGLKIAHESTCHLITIDLKMSPMNGYELVDVILNDEKLNKIPLVLISIMANEVKSKIKGVKAYVNKPVNIEELKILLQSI